MIRRHALADVLARKLQLSPCQSEIVAKLWRVGNRWISASDLNESVAPGEERLHPAVRVHVHAIRQRLGAEFVLGHRAHGYTLGAPGVLACRRVIANAG